MNKKQQLPIAKFLLVGTIIAFGIFLIVPSTIPAHGFHKETALLKKYKNLPELVNDIRNGKVDFKEFRDSDGIALAVMKDSEIYDKADTATKDCIDFAGKVRNSLGDREIVHCSEDTNYFKSKFSPNTSVPASSLTSHPADSGNATSDTNLSTQTNGTSSSSQTTSRSSADNIDKNILIDQLVKTGKFTENEAVEFSIIHELVNKQKFTENQAINFAKKIMQSRNQMTSATTALPTATTTPDTDTNADDVSKASNNDTKTAKASLAGNPNTNDNPANSATENPEDYNDLGQLVHDIKNGDLDADRISLKDFQNSVAYKGADKQMQVCIDFAGKVGNNLDDSEIVHCSEDTNYFKNKYSS